MRNLSKLFRFSSSSPHSLFRERKLLYQSTSKLLNEDNFIQSHQQKINNNHPLSIYCGYDPTAQSLHLGNLVSIIMMARLQQQFNLRPIFVLGGATGMIGDPSGKTEERKLLEEEKLNKNMKGVEFDLKNVFSNLKKDLQENKIQYGLATRNNKKIPEQILINNSTFYQEMNILEFFRKVGKVFRMNSLLSKETVANRLKSEEGISYTEFSYSLIQAYDFYILNKNYGCILQFGGSDQWGNITNGCDLVKKISGGENEVYGITMPLLVEKNGKKFGKSEGNALFLNQQKTPLSKIYEYLFNTADEDVEKLLFIFTFFSPQKIESIMQAHLKNTELRIAQRILAEKVVSYLGQYTNLQQKIFKLSPSEIKGLKLEFFHDLFKELPPDMKKIISLSDNSIKDFPDFLLQVGLVSGKKQARRQIEKKGFYINNQQIDKQLINRPFCQIQKEYILHEKYMIVRRGKKKYIFVQFIS